MLTSYLMETVKKKKKIKTITKKNINYSKLYSKLKIYFYFTNQSHLNVSNCHLTIYFFLQSYIII